MLRLTDAALAHLRADLDRTATEQPKSGRIPLTVRELGGLLARLDAAEAALGALLAHGIPIVDEIAAWEETRQPFSKKEVAS